MFQENESYKHKLAKDILADKLLEIDNINDHCEFYGLKWRKSYGVFKELKFYETSDPYYFELSKGLLPHIGFDNDGIDKRGKNYLEWFHRYIFRGNILFVPDITIFHKGVATIFIEIVHTHSLGLKKIQSIQNFFEGHSIQVYEVYAEQILRNTIQDFKHCEFQEVLIS